MRNQGQGEKTPRPGRTYRQSALLSPSLTHGCSVKEERSGGARQGAYPFNLAVLPAVSARGRCSIIARGRSCSLSTPSLPARKHTDQRHGETGQAPRMRAAQSCALAWPSGDPSDVGLLHNLNWFESRIPVLSLGSGGDGRNELVPPAHGERNVAWHVTGCLDHCGPTPCTSCAL